MPFGLRTLATVAAVALLAASPASGDMVHDLTGQEWQFDGGKPGDAPGACLDAAVALPMNTQSSGFSLPVLDGADHFLLPVSRDDVGKTVAVRAKAFPVLGDQGLPLEGLQLRVWAEGCGQSVGKGQGPGLVTFIPTKAGRYVIELSWPDPLGLDGEAGVPVPWAYHTDCQPFCASYGPALNELVGYVFSADAS